jgi:hypothetical protein
MPEAGGNPGRAVVERPGQRPLEHAGIELVGLAIGVDVGAWEPRREQRIAEAGADANSSSTKASSARRNAASGTAAWARNSEG